MSVSITYAEFKEYRAKLNLALEDVANGKKSAASNRLRAVKKALDEWEAQRKDINCESEGRLNYLQKLAADVAGG